MSGALQVRRKDLIVHCGASDAIIESEDAEAGVAKEGMEATAMRRMVESCMVDESGLLIVDIGSICILLLLPQRGGLCLWERHQRGKFPRPYIYADGTSDPTMYSPRSSFLLNMVQKGI